MRLSAWHRAVCRSRGRASLSDQRSGQMHDGHKFLLTVSFGSSSEEFNVSESSLHYPSDQALLCMCEKVRRRAQEQSLGAPKLADRRNDRAWSLIPMTIDNPTLNRGTTPKLQGCPSPSRILPGLSRIGSTEPEIARGNHRSATSFAALHSECFAPAPRALKA
jgi:hypothetical protein